MMVAIGLGVTFADVLLVTKDWKLVLSALSAPPHFRDRRSFATGGLLCEAKRPT